MGLIMNEELMARLHQDAYNEIMLPFLVVKNGTPILHYETTDMVEGKVRLKFAELMIKECIDICNNHYSIEGIAQNIEKDIREHFGMEDNND